MSTQRKLGSGWQFSKQPLHSELAKVEANTDWMPVTLPHDWLIYNAEALYETGEGWYRTTLHLQEVPADRILFVQ
ncbi:hypothetical protein [Paenibacillus donghaensis]|uniref:Uncharacterized protein n=1 Tax=Paenibacillus donghaensis TaxID=414771 RepID=A0A2Z2KBW3_9BACL|nr:hypothetical protein [Paenibacillus donghaensis]ASA23264.1 hypothetical protein B9T62_22110 [Paenibacillus donghaensis]